MEVLQKKIIVHQRYAAALRENIASRLARQGATPQLLAQLRKIKEFECRFRPLEESPIAARSFSDEILSAAVLIGMTQNRYLPVGFSGIGLYSMDAGIYRQFLLALFRAGLRGGKSLRLHFSHTGIQLYCSGFWPDEISHRFLLRMGGYLLKLRGTRKDALLVLPVPLAKRQKPAPVPTLADYLDNALSDVYLYLAP